MQNVPNVILLAKTEEFSDLGGSLGTKSLWVDNIGQTWNVRLTLLDNGKSENRQILTNDATTNRLSLTLTRSARSVARVATGKEESDSGW